MRASLPLLDALLTKTRIVGLDIGARGGFTGDLEPIAPGVDAIGFEPDKTECDRLNASAGADRGGWRSLRYVPVAVGQPGKRTLNLYKKRGCTSLLTADLDLAKEFAREDFFVLEGQVPVQVTRMDDAAAQFDFAGAHFMKIDIQGAELEVFQTGAKLVGQSLLCIRSEVEFAPLYKNQPLFSDIDADLRGKGFMFAGFPELHAWRRGTETKPDRWNGGLVPLSEAQLIHGDVLYFRDPRTMGDATPADQDRLIALALLAFSYGHLDLCASLLTRPTIAPRVRDLANIDARDLIAEIARWHVKRRKDELASFAGKHLRNFLRLAGR
jgi:FkbM family methyltransferase